MTEIQTIVASPLLTNEEAVKFLRIDEDYPDDMANAIKALHRLVQAGRIRPITGCGKTYKFAIAELERFAREEGLTPRRDVTAKPRRRKPNRTTGNGRAQNNRGQSASQTQVNEN